MVGRAYAGLGRVRGTVNVALIILSFTFGVGLVAGVGLAALVHHGERAEIEQCRAQASSTACSCWRAP